MTVTFYNARKLLVSFPKTGTLSFPMSFLMKNRLIN